MRQFARGGFFVVDVGIGSDPADDLAIRIANRHALGEKPAIDAVLRAAQPNLAFEDRTGAVGRALHASATAS